MVTNSGDKTENSLGFYDYWIVKVNVSGDIEWDNTIGGNYVDELQSIHQTFDGGYILGGYSLSGISGDKTEKAFRMFGYNTSDYWVIKLNSMGSIEWQNTIGGKNQDYLYDIQQTADSGYILGGYSFSEYQVTKQKIMSVLLIIGS